MDKDILEIIEFTKFDGYERYATVKIKDLNQQCYIHFLQCDEYLERGETSRLLKPGDRITGTLMIDLVSSAEITSEVTCYEQAIQGYPHIEAIADIIQIKDDFEMICNIDGLSESILVSFERKADFQVGDRISFKGSLELEIS